MMSNDEVGTPDNNQQNPFYLYRQSQPENTTRTIQSNIKTFCDFLSTISIERSVDDLTLDGRSWRFISVDVHERFRRWLMDKGYAPRTIRLKIACVKKHISLAVETGDVDPLVFATIRGLSASEDQGYEGRISGKKEMYDALSIEQARLLKTDHPSTPQGARDKLVLCLCLDLGLRPSELENLLVSDVDLISRRILVRRTKYIIEQTHEMSDDVFGAISEYLDCVGAPRKGRLIRATRKSKQLDGNKFTSSNIGKRIRQLGEAILNKDDLTPGDLRKTFAVHAKLAGTDLDVVRRAGGWKNATMPERYIDETGSTRFANDGLKLPRKSRD